jgi:hypothetical protein
MAPMILAAVGSTQHAALAHFLDAEGIECRTRRRRP